MMGGGAYGVVCSASDEKKKRKVAIKKIEKAFEDLIDAKRIYREIKLLKFLKHKNIIKIYDMVLPDKSKSFNDIYIVTELMETDLHRVIYSKQKLSDEHIQYFIFQILNAVNYMHSSNIIHRDLKPSNILLNKKCDIKICDLGLGRGYDTEEEFKTEYVVTRWYRAPEVILNASEYTKAIDIWSIGCILAELLGRTALFPGDNYLDQIQRIVSILGTPKYSDISYISNEKALEFIKSLPKRSRQPWGLLYPKANPLACDLLGVMLAFNPDKRAGVEECLDHPYFEDLEREGIKGKKVFDWSVDKFEPKAPLLRELIYKEALAYHLK